MYRAGSLSFHFRGFTLLEMMIVLVIAALILAVAPPLLSRALPGTQLKGAARQIAAGLRYTRGHAVISQQEAVFKLDVEARRAEISGRAKPLKLPQDLDLRLFTAQAELVDEQVGAVRFYPDGSATGGRITVAYDEREYHVDIDWLTGHVAISQ